MGTARPSTWKVLSPPEPLDCRPATLPGNRTTGRRWRLRRNLVISLANRQGASQRLLADVFDLAPSRIAAILKQMRERPLSLVPGDSDEDLEHEVA